MKYLPLILLFFSINVFSENTSNDSTLFNSSLKKGIEYWQKSEFDSSLFFYEKAYNIANSNSNEINKASARLNMASIYIIKKDFKTAISLTEEIVKVFEKAGDKEKAAVCYNNLGLSYSELNDNENALIYFNKSLEIKKSKGSIGYAKTLVNIAAIYEKDKKFSNSLDYYFEALKIFTQEKDSFNIASSLYDIAKSYYFNKELEQAETYANRAIDIATEIDAIWFITISKNLLSLIKTESNDYISALKYFKEYKQLSDSMLEIKNKYQYNSLLVKYETREYKNKSEIQTIKINHQNNYLMMQSVIIALFLLIIVFVFYFLQKQRKNNKLLLKQNLELTKSELELDNYKEEVKVLDENLENKNQEDLHYKLMLSINTDKVYRNKGITIFELADILDTNKSYLSKVINDKYNQNFNVFINSFRIKEARKLLSDPKSKKYTIASIADEVGFNSISAFNKVFKEVTGLTPSYFMKSVK